MIDKNNTLVFQSIMALNKCDLISAIKFSEHNQTCFNLAMAVAQAKDDERKWHKVAEDDMPKEGGNYWCKLKGEYHQGSSHYKQHCNDGYCILQWLPKKKAWNVRYNTEVEAWIELPKYNEE